ncbi:VOC family protein [Mesorhizobium sp. 128a]
MQSANGNLSIPDQQIEGTRLGAVHLRVTDLDGALGVWRDIVGLSVIERHLGKVMLGAGGRQLVVLHATAARQVQTKSLGLYHVAIHIPSRKEFARAAARLRAAGYKHSATDHLATESIYLADPDGNGIELTFETFHRGHFENADGGIRAVAVDGSIHTGLEPLQIAQLLEELAGDSSIVEPLPAGTNVGHVHLHVSDPEATTSFYAGILGFKPRICAPKFGMYDVGTQLRPHIVAYNTWAGPEAVRVAQDCSGLELIVIELPSREVLDTVVQRLTQAGLALAAEGDARLVSDPDGNRLSITSREPGL